MKRTIIDPSQLELEDNVVTIKRVTKVVKGGRNMRFTALVVVGDKNGHVGAGLGKATEIPEAIRKGKEAAEKNLVEVPIDENGSVPHDFNGKFGSASVQKVLESSPVVRHVPYLSLQDTRTFVQSLLVQTTSRTLYLQQSRDLRILRLLRRLQRLVVFL